jgi:hypothetical protein
MRWAFLLMLFAAPLALGSYRPPAYIPLIILAYGIGIASWFRARLARAYGEPATPVPGARLLLLLLGLALLQLVPLPPFLLAFLSPGSYVFHGRPSGLAPSSWQPVTVWPSWTAQAIVYMGGVSLLYAAAYRDFRERPWRRRLVVTVATTGVVLALIGLVQEASADPRKIYGIWKPRVSWAVFGPYENRTYFANYLILAIPLAAGLAVQAARATAYAWRRRGRRRWLSLLDGEGPAALRWTAAAVTLVIGLLASQSRGGLAAFAVSLAVLAVLMRRRSVILVAVVALLPLAFWALQEGRINHGEPLWSPNDQRLSVRPIIWRDALRMVPEFPLLGSGLGSFPAAYRRYQTVIMTYVIPNAHNEYLELMFDMGIAGTVVMALLAVEFLRRGVAAARADTLAAAAFAGVAAGALHNIVDSNWHIPANAVTFAVLAGLAVQPPRLERGARVEAPSAEPGAVPAVSAPGLSIRPPKAARGMAS